MNEQVARSVQRTPSGGTTDSQQATAQRNTTAPLNRNDILDKVTSNVPVGPVGGGEVVDYEKLVEFPLGDYWFKLTLRDQYNYQLTFPAGWGHLGTEDQYFRIEINNAKPAVVNPIKDFAAAPSGAGGGITSVPAKQEVIGIGSSDQRVDVLSGRASWAATYPARYPSLNLDTPPAPASRQQQGDA